MIDAVLEKIVRDEMGKAGVWPQNPWKPNKNTRKWLEERGFKMDYLPGSNNYPPGGNARPTWWEYEKEGFLRLSLRHRSRYMPASCKRWICSASAVLIYIPKEMVERIAVFGAIPPLK